MDALDEGDGDPGSIVADKIADLGTVNVYRIVDSEAGVVCWIAREYRGVGVSCLPIADTKLDHQ